MKRNNLSALLLLTVGVVVLILALIHFTGMGSTSATPLHPMVARVFDDLSKRADLIVAGEVVSQDTRDEGNAFHTYTTVAVNETLKGHSPSSAIVIRSRGGVVGGIAEAFLGQVTFRRGERVLLFLQERAPFFEVLDDALGKYVIGIPAGSGPELVKVDRNAHQIDFVAPPGEEFFATMDKGVGASTVLNYIRARR